MICEYHTYFLSLRSEKKLLLTKNNIYYLLITKESICFICKKSLIVKKLYKILTIIINEILILYDFNFKTVFSYY
jgi:hypothetical protein